MGSVPRWAFPRSVFCPRPCPPSVVPCAAAQGFPPPMLPRGPPLPLFALRWWLSPLAPHGRAQGAPAARWRGRWAFSRVRSDRGAHPTRKARRGTRRASEPGRGVEDPPGGGKTAQGNACRPPSGRTVRYQLRYQNLKALPQIGQYRQYSRTGYPQKGHSGPSGTMIISVLRFSPFYWTVSS